MGTFGVSGPIFPTISHFLGHHVHWTFNGWTENSLLAQIRVQSCSKQLSSQPDEKHYLYTEQSSESVLSLVSGTKILVKIAMMRQTTEWPKKSAAKPRSWGSKATILKQTRHFLAQLLFFRDFIGACFLEEKGRGIPFSSFSLNSFWAMSFQSIVAALRRYAHPITLKV